MGKNGQSHYSGFKVGPPKLTPLRNRGAQKFSQRDFLVQFWPIFGSREIRNTDFAQISASSATLRRRHMRPKISHAPKKPFRPIIYGFRAGATSSVLSLLQQVIFSSIVLLLELYIYMYRIKIGLSPYSSLIVILTFLCTFFLQHSEILSSTCGFFRKFLYIFLLFYYLLYFFIVFIYLHDSVILHLIVKCVIRINMLHIFIDNAQNTWYLYHSFNYYV